MRMTKTFVLLHGAWHGGWCWERVAEPLRARGHRVTTPTQTGLGERAHLLSGEITLQTFIDDLVNHLLFEDLKNVTLVGHSFGGNGISGAAEVIPERIKDLVYLDCTIMEAGETLLDKLAPGALRQRIEAFEASPDGLGVAAPDPSVFGVMDVADQDWVAARLTPHPISTMRAPLPLQGPPGAGLPARYIMCTDPQYQVAERVHAWGTRFDWPIEEIATGHDAMVTAPSALVDMLDR